MKILITFLTVALTGLASAQATSINVSCTGSQQLKGLHFDGILNGDQPVQILADPATQTTVTLTYNTSGIGGPKGTLILGVVKFTANQPSAQLIAVGSPQFTELVYQNAAIKETLTVICGQGRSLR